jgi:hypothetical protein
MPSATSMPSGTTSIPDSGVEAQPENGSPALPESTTVLEEFARWLTRDNAQFDANLANRIWFQYFGRGIVDPPDDFRDSNPPSNPALLDWLAKELRKSDYSMKRLSRLILTSDTFARRSTGDLVPPTVLNPVPYFSGYPIRRLQAEALMDALSDATGAIDRLQGIGEEENAAPITHAMRMPGVPRRPGFLTAFGKPNRLLVCECERSNAVSLGQSLVMVNGREVREKLAASQNRIDELIRSGRDDSEILDELFLASLCRLPSETERAASLELLRSISDRPQSLDAAALAIRQQLTAASYRRRRAFEDILWALLNSKEFLLLR